MAFMRTRSVLVFLALFLFQCFLAGCSGESKDSNTSTLDEISKALQYGIDEGSKALEKVKPEADRYQGMANDEVEKLFTLEYRVVEAPRSMSSAELEVFMNQLGQERWECFHIEELTEKYRIYCNRKPRTYLRMIPRIF